MNEISLLMCECETISKAVAIESYFRKRGFVQLFDGSVLMADLVRWSYLDDGDTLP